MLIVNLTAEQIKELSAALDKIGEMADAGKPGILFAQIYGDHMRVGIMSNDAALKFYDAIGTPEERRGTHRTAYELLQKERSGGPKCNLSRPWEEPQ